MSFVEVLPIELSYIIFDCTGGYNIFCKCVCKSWRAILAHVKYDEQLIIACWLEHDDPRLLTKRCWLRPEYEARHSQAIVTAINTGRTTHLLQLLDKRKIGMSQNMRILTTKSAVAHFANEIANHCCGGIAYRSRRIKVFKLAFNVENYDFIRCHIDQFPELADFTFNEIFNAIKNVKSIEWLYEQYKHVVDKRWHELRGVMVKHNRLEVLDWIKNYRN